MTRFVAMVFIGVGMVFVIGMMGAVILYLVKEYWE